MREKKKDQCWEMKRRENFSKHEKTLDEIIVCKTTTDNVKKNWIWSVKYSFHFHLFCVHWQFCLFAFWHYYYDSIKSLSLYLHQNVVSMTSRLAWLAQRDIYSMQCFLYENWKYVWPRLFVNMNSHTVNLSVSPCWIVTILTMTSKIRNFIKLDETKWE